MKKLFVEVGVFFIEFVKRMIIRAVEENSAVVVMKIRLK